MQRTSRTPPVVAIDKVDNKIVRLQPRSAAAVGESEVLAVETLPALMERASNAVRQMRYFALATKRFSFGELIPSAARAGFHLVSEDSQGDIFGLMLTAYSHISTISVETSPTLENSELGQNALLFRDMLLTFPDFDEMPAWTKYSEKQAPSVGSLLELWRDGLSLASLADWTWKSIRSSVSTAWETLRDRWNSYRLPRR